MLFLSVFVCRKKDPVENIILQIFQKRKNEFKLKRVVRKFTMYM